MTEIKIFDMTIYWSYYSHMYKITISKLKATLCAELKRIRKGESAVVLDRSTPIALLSPIPNNIQVARKKSKPYTFQELSPLTSKDPLECLDNERGERW